MASRSVSLGPRAESALTEVREATGDSEYDVFNRAVPLYAMVTKAVAEGRKIMIHTPGDGEDTGSTAELHIL